MRTTKTKARTYLQLLAEYEPAPIRSETGHRLRLSQVDDLMAKKKLTAAEHKMLELLASIVQTYQDEHYWPAKVTAGDALEHLIDARGIKQVDVARGTGIGPSTVSQILAGRRKPSKQAACKLADFFKVPIKLFLEAGGAEPIGNPVERMGNFKIVISGEKVESKEAFKASAELNRQARIR